MYFFGKYVAFMKFYTIINTFNKSINNSYNYCLSPLNVL